MRGIYAAFAVAALTACVGTEEPVTDTNTACGAAAMQGLVGQPESVIAAMTFAAPVRILHPGDAMTMDYNPTRLNIMIDARGRVEKIFCG